MSRIGNRIISVPQGVAIEITKDIIKVNGPKGNLTVNFPNCIKLEQNDNKIVVKRINELKQTKMYHGTVNANLSNAIIGVTTEFKKELVLKGVGYKAKVEGKNLNISLGFSHPIILEIPNGLKVDIPTPTEIIVSGIDKAAVGQLCAVIRAYRKPEPYKGKGVLFKGEQIIRKAGKTADK